MNVIGTEETIASEVMKVTGLDIDQAWQLVANVGLKLHTFWSNGRVGAYGVRCSFDAADVEGVRQ